LKEFLDDIELTFDNCITYNGDTNVGKLCLTVREEFRKIYKQLNIDFYLREGQQAGKGAQLSQQALD
jgi:hypothetical protein